jgi:uncharacterized protein
MKYLLVLLVLLFAFWIWRNNRQTAERDDTPKPRAPRGPVAMIACAQCGTHVPEAEVVQGTRGRYCCAEHRRQHEASAR